MTTTLAFLLFREKKEGTTTQYTKSQLTIPNGRNFSRLWALFGRWRKNMWHPETKRKGRKKKKRKKRKISEKKERKRERREIDKRNKLMDRRVFHHTSAQEFHARSCCCRFSRLTEAAFSATVFILGRATRDEGKKRKEKKQLASNNYNLLHSLLPPSSGDDDSGMKRGNAAEIDGAKGREKERDCMCTRREEKNKEWSRKKIKLYRVFLLLLLFFGSFILFFSGRNLCVIEGVPLRHAPCNRGFTAVPFSLLLRLRRRRLLLLLPFRPLDPNIRRLCFYYRADPHGRKCCYARKS